MLIKYLIPEDGDEQSHPNVFSIGSVLTPTLGQIRKIFPIPGKYHFRYLRNVGNMTVWMDAVDEAFVIPPFDGRIFLKASRINESPQRPQTVQRQAPPRSNSVSNPPPRPVISKPPGSSETLLAFGSDDINEDDMQSSSSHQVTAASFMDSNNNDLIGLSSDPITSNIPKSSSNIDMFGIDSLQPTLMPMSVPHTPSPNNSYSSGSPNRSHLHQDNGMGQRGMVGVGMGLNNGGVNASRGISPLPIDAFSGLGSQQQQQSRQPARRPY